LTEERKPVPPLLRFKYRVAYHLIFKKLKEALGGRVRWITASGAPTSPEIIRFFIAAGIMVIEGYGMTECTAPATMSNLADYKIGTVGKPLPGVEIKIADDGEILVKVANVFRGYWKMEEETRNSFTEDGYFLTGDTGTISEDGFLKIVDRKKDLIITSGGKNVAPQKIENLFKGDPLFAQVIVIGEKRKYLTALMNINPDHAVQVARASNIPFDKPEDLLENREFLAVVDERVAELNAYLARYETIKRYTIIEHQFSKETGELTATLKVKRRVVRERYRDLIDSMYDDETQQAGVL
jgi:long-chain acyl-CoA synthetase